MKPEDERLFFEHDLATPVTNLQGASYLLRMGARPGDESAWEALDILDANIRALERMMGWYWRLRDLESGPAPAEPWSASQLPGLVGGLISTEKVPLPVPEGALANRPLTVPQQPLLCGLVGAGLTLAAAAGASPAWGFLDRDVDVACTYQVPGDPDALDPERLFRKVYWPSRSRLAAWLDPGLPYLKALLAPIGGSLELRWSDRGWELEAAVPVAP